MLRTLFVKKSVFICRVQYRIIKLHFILYLKSPQGTALGGKQPLLSTECPSQNLRFFDVRFARLLSERHLKTFGFFDVRCAHIIS